MTALRYVTPLREGGSLPGIMEADDLGTYVVKFVGAGQGRKVLVAEVLVGELGRLLGLPVPELVLVDVDPVLGRAEPDEEVQDLLRASPGLNLGTDYLPGALGFDPNAHTVDPDLASRVLWFDALVGNVDRVLVHTVSATGLTAVVVVVYLVIVIGLGRAPADTERTFEELKTLVQAIQEGVTDPWQLTDLIFYARHPEMKGVP